MLPRARPRRLRLRRPEDERSAPGSRAGDRADGARGPRRRRARAREAGADPCDAGGRPGCAAAAGLRPADFEPTPDDVACTELFGGPETATVTGTLDGREVDARFARNDGCEIARWEKVAALLEPAG